MSDGAGCPVAHGYDPLAPDTLLDPYSALNPLRDAGPVFYLPELDHYIVTRYDDVEQVLFDRETWSAANASSPLIPVAPSAQKVLDEGFKRVPTLNNADPPRHGPMRRSVLTCMTPRRLNALEPVLREYASGLVDAFAGEEVVDLIDVLAFPFPGFAAFSLLGFPDADTEQLRAWSQRRVLLTYGRLSEADQISVAHDIVAMWRYVEDFVASRAADPVDDMTSDLVRLSEEKPDQLNQFDIVNIVYSMLLAGHETTQNAIGSGMLALLRDRAQWKALLADRLLIPNAVEEILRFDGPVVNHRRLAKVDTTIGGTPIPAGAKVMLCFASAAHDPSHFSDPDDFQADRADATQHFAFGRGPHFCLGAPLARLELRIVLELLTATTPDIELVPDQVLRYSPNALFRSLQHLLVAPGGLARVARHRASGVGS
jgi:cytochrome P450